MQIHGSKQFPQALRSRFLLWVAALVVIGIFVYAMSQRPAPKPATPAPNPVALSNSLSGPVQAEVITSQATDRYEFLADVLRQLSAHPQVTCRDEVAGPHGLQEELAKASALKVQGKLQDASLMLKAIEKRLDRKFQAECLKLG